MPYEYYIISPREFDEKADDWINSGSYPIDPVTGEEASGKDRALQLFLKDLPKLDFKRIEGVSVYVTDMLYQVYLREELCLEFYGPDARNFASSVLMYRQHRPYRNGYDMVIRYDSGFMCFHLEDDEQQNYIRLARREHHESMPPVVLLRPTARLRYPDWTHAKG